MNVQVVALGEPRVGVEVAGVVLRARDLPEPDRERVAVGQRPRLALLGRLAGDLEVVDVARVRPQPADVDADRPVGLRAARGTGRCRRAGRTGPRGSASAPATGVGARGAADPRPDDDAARRRVAAGDAVPEGAPAGEPEHGRTRAQAGRAASTAGASWIACAARMPGLERALDPGVVQRAVLAGEVDPALGPDDVRLELRSAARPRTARTRRSRTGRRTRRATRRPRTPRGSGGGSCATSSSASSSRVSSSIAPQRAASCDPRVAREQHAAGRGRDRASGSSCAGSGRSVTDRAAVDAVVGLPDALAEPGTGSSSRPSS